MNDKKRKILIIITILLLVVLVGVGVVMLVTQPTEKKETSNNEETKNNRCYEELCISKISVDESNETKTLILTLKNEGDTTIPGKCVTLKSENASMDFCTQEMAKDEEISFVFGANELPGKDIKDYSLEKTEITNQETNNEVVE